MSLSASTKSITHPVSFIAVIVTQTMFLCLVSSLSYSTPWFAFVLFLIFMGGVIVLFIYISRLASNENFLLNQKDALFSAILSTALFAILLISFYNPISSLNNKPINILEVIYSIKFAPFLLCLIVYLLFTLLVVSGIVKINKSPIRSIL